MALNFDTGDESAFARLGKILKIPYLTTPYEASLPAAFLEINDGYVTTLTAVGGQVATQANQLARSASNTMTYASQAAWGVVQGMVLADQPSQAGTQYSAMAEFIRQMKLQSKTVQASTIGSSAAALTPFTGTGVLVLTTKRGDGLVQENTIAETLRLVCTADAYTGGATSGQETFGLTGSPVSAGVWDYDWPTGSGAQTSGNAVSADQDATSGGNLTTNGDFQDWTDDATPELVSWQLGGTGAWGTDVQRNSSDPFRSGQDYALQFNPGANNPVIYQVFADGTNGSQATLAGLTSFQVNLWLRKLSGTISAGVLTVELTDNSGTVTADAQGVNNSFTVTLSTLTTGYVAYSGTFRLSATPPASVQLQLRISTDLAGASFLAADVCCAAVRAMYQGGPGYNVFSGATPFVGGDGWTITNTNNQGGASYLATFQTGFQRLFSMTEMGLLLPSSGSPNISNALITA